MSLGSIFGGFDDDYPKAQKSQLRASQKTLNALNLVLNRYQDTVVFADLNLKMNLLWISIKPIKGIFAEIPAAIIEQIPEAKPISECPPK